MKSLREKVIDYIMQRIDSGEWAVGYKIPTEIELCDTFQVSRQTVRSAILELVSRGCLHRIKGNGTYVTRPRHLENTSVFIESFDEGKTGKRIKSEVLELRECQPEPEVCNLLQSEAKAIKLTRLRYLEGSFEQGPIVLTTTYFPIEYGFILQTDFEKEYMHTVLEEHGIVRYTIQKEMIPIELTQRQMLLTASNQKSLGMLVQSVDRDETDHIVCVTQSYYPAERNHFTLTYTL